MQINKKVSKGQSNKKTSIDNITNINVSNAEIKRSDFLTYEAYLKAWEKEDAKAVGFIEDMENVHFPKCVAIALLVMAVTVLLGVQVCSGKFEGQSVAEGATCTRTLLNVILN